MSKKHSALTIAALFIPVFMTGVGALANDGYPRPTAWDSRINQIRHFTSGQDTSSQSGTSDDTAYYNAAPAGANAAATYQNAQNQADLLDAQGRARRIMAIAGQNNAPEQLSALERMYQRQIVDPLSQFGYDLFGVPSDETQNFLAALARDSYSIPTGSVADDFILDMGDQLEIVFTGQRGDRGTYTINPRGQLLIPDFPPIPAAGRSIGQVRISVEAAARNLHNTQAYISLASVRQIGVLIVGHVRRPDRQSLTVFHTILDALMQSGGIEKTGSLRQIKLIRDGRSQLIDIYSLLLYGATNADLQLRDGDRIIVPPIGPTIAISGEVKRPGIFEIQPRYTGMKDRAVNTSELLSLNEALELAGGVLVSGDNRFVKMGIGADGSKSVQEIQDPFEKTIGDGSVLIVSQGDEKHGGMVELIGHTRKPGVYALAKTPNLSDLLPDSGVLSNDVYPLIGVIERFDPNQLTRQYIEFPLRDVISGEYDRNLQEDDVIHLFSNAQIKALGASQPGSAGNIHENNTREGFIEAGYHPAQPSYNHEQYGEGSRLLNPHDEAKLDVLLSGFLKERAVFVRGAVRNPGYFPVAEGATLDAVIAAAGGLALEANTGNIEVTSNMLGEGLQKNRRSGTRRMTINMRETDLQNVSIGAGDSVRVNQRFDKISDRSVLIIGEVRNPGRYDLIPGDKVSDLLDRAGGLTQQAYPQGTIFSRASDRKAEESRYRSAARDLERSLAVQLEKGGKDTPNTTQIAMARELATELREVEAVGRITVETDPGILARQPELDMLLESDDRIFIPKRPMTVRVNGEILSPASLQFREGKKPLDYIHEAGGFTYHADKDRTFVLYPDGSAQPLQVSSWNYRPIFIPPGSTIVVPRDPKPFDFIESAKDVSQILSNLAVTAIFLDDVRDND